MRFSEDWGEFEEYWHDIEEEERMNKLTDEFTASSYEIESLIETLVITDYESIYKEAKKEEPAFYNNGLKKKTIKESIKPQRHKPKNKNRR